MRVVCIFPLSFVIAFLPAVVFAAEPLNERLFAELHLIIGFHSKFVSSIEEPTREFDRESCVTISSQGTAPMSPSCEEQSLQQLKAMDDRNQKSEEYLTKMVEGWAKIYGMLRVAHMHCGYTSLDFEAVPALLSAQSSKINQDADALILMYIEAAEGALEQDLDAIDCNAIQSFNATIERMMIAVRRAMKKVR